MSRWLPDPGEERWLAVAARLRKVLARDALLDRAGGWRSTGPFARIALFALGCLAAGLLLSLFWIGDEPRVLPAAIVAIGAAEWLKQAKRLHASGVEEGLCYGGCVLAGLWAVTETGPGPNAYLAALILVTGAAGLRLLNAALTTGAALYAIVWLESQPFARAVDGAIGNGMTALLLAGAVAVAALAASSHEFRRPSHARMLDWLVVAMALFVSARRATSGWLMPFAASSAGPAARVAACLLLLVLASVSLAAGVRRRRHAPLLAGLLFTAGLVVELQFAIGGPVEAWLSLSGIALIAAGAFLERRLQQPHAGITSAKLTDRDDPTDLMQAAGAALAMRTIQPQPVAGGSAHDGQFGGGGASGNF